MVRTKREIKPIEDKVKRHTAFTKRRQGLIKKTKSFVNMFDAQAAVIVFSEAGNLFGFGNPTVDALVSRYLAAEHPVREEEEEEGRPAAPEGLTEEESERRIAEALKVGNWSSAVEVLDARKLDELSEEIVRMKRTVAARAAELAGRTGAGVEARGKEDGSPGGGSGSGGGSIIDSPVNGIFGGKS